MPDDDAALHTGDLIVPLGDRLGAIEAHIRRLSWIIGGLIVVEILRALTTPDQLAAILGALADLVT